MHASTVNTRKPHPQLSGMILEKKLPKRQSDINKSINSQNTFEKCFLNRFPYSLWLTTVVFIAKAHSLNENKAQEYDAKRSLVTTRHGNGRFCISCAWISCLSRHMEAIDWRKLVAKREFDNPMDKHAVKVVLGNKTVGHLPREFSRIAWYFRARSGEISVKVIGRRRHCKQLCGGIPCQNYWRTIFGFRTQRSKQTAP